MSCYDDQFNRRPSLTTALALKAPSKNCVRRRWPSSFSIKSPVDSSKNFYAYEAAPMVPENFTDNGLLT